jgi:hypothetical protein
MFQKDVTRYVIDPTWRAIVLPLFWTNTVIWDAVCFIITPLLTPRNILVCLAESTARALAEPIPMDPTPTSLFICHVLARIRSNILC